MFGKKCRRCGEKISDKHRYCSNCGTSVNKYSDQDFGMLGRDDLKESQNPFSDPLLDGFGGNMLNKMLGSAMKMLEREMKREMTRTSPQPKTKIKLMINGKEINFEDKQNQVEERQIKREEHFNHPPEKKLKNFSKLKKEETQTNIRR